MDRIGRLFIGTLTLSLSSLCAAQAFEIDQQGEQAFLQQIRRNGFGFTVEEVTPLQSTPPVPPPSLPPVSGISPIDRIPRVPLDNDTLAYLMDYLIMDNYEPTLASPNVFFETLIGDDQGAAEAQGVSGSSMRLAQDPLPPVPVWSIPQPASESFLAPTQVLQFADYLGEYVPPSTSRVVGEFESFIAIAQDEQNRCFTPLDHSLRGVRFNAIGLIRVMDTDGNCKFCTGTMVTDQLVITIASCLLMQGVVVSYAYQPAWAGWDDWWNIPIEFVFDGNLMENGNSTDSFEYAVLKLEQNIVGAVWMYHRLFQEQTGTCYVTVLGWKQTSYQSKDFQLIDCPNIPNIREQLGIEGDQCGKLCNLDYLDLAEGSPIVLICDPSPAQYIFTTSFTVVGMLQNYRQERTATIPYLQQSQQSMVPYMFVSDVWNVLDS
eukprot:TRINITY_DN6410_c0_g1_i7.p1 TRINITY_DN6410_c0_g1~~TRINITY_DN6410_c0_g1_i7.p1  ORF type:complete len:469 (-),score=34.87 TRINITY_DN6410_c0_g1_i7:43-1341(-)